jgi:hypothetical protein
LFGDEGDASSAASKQVKRGWRTTIMFRASVVCLVLTLVSLHRVYPQSHVTDDPRTAVLNLETRYPHAVDLSSNSYDFRGRLLLGPCFAVGAEGNLVLVASGQSLKLLDAGDIASPRDISEYVSSDFPLNINVRDSLAYVCSNDSLLILHISRDEGFRFVSALEIPGWPARVQVADSVAYVINRSGYLYAVDISDRERPRIRGAAAAPDFIQSAFVAQRHTVYISVPTSNVLSIYDARNLDTITTSHVIFAYRIQSAALRDSILCISFFAPPDYPATRLFSVTNPSSPRELASINNRAEAVAFVGSKLMLALADTLFFYETSQSTFPVPLTSITVGSLTNSGACELAVSKTRAVVRHKTGAFVVDISQADIALSGSYIKTGSFISKVFMKDSLAFLASNEAGLWIASVADPAQPRLMSNLMISGSVWDVAVEGNLAVLLVPANLPGDPRRGLWMIDVTDANHPRVLGRHVGIIDYPDDAHPNVIKLRKSVVYVAQSGLGSPTNVFEMVDVTNPGAAVTLGVLPGRFNCFDVSANDRQAFLASPDSGLVIVDISDPQHLTETARIPMDAYAVTCDDTLVYVNGAYLHVVRSVAGESPSVLSSMFVYYGVSWMRTCLDGKTLYWAQNGAGAVDVSVPTAPSPVPGFPPMTDAQDIFSSNGNVYVSYPISGLYIWSRTPTAISGSPNSPRPGFDLCQNFPNPFNPVTTIRFSLPGQRHVSLEVYNVLGQKVASLINNTLGPGRYDVNFDGRNLASGTYFCRLSDGGLQVTRAMMLVR